MKLTKDCLTTGAKQVFCSGANGTLAFYLNGVKTDTLLDLPINHGDRSLITFGNVGSEQLQDQLKIFKIQKEVPPPSSVGETSLLNLMQSII